MSEVTTAVITAAGRGTRLSPLTRAIQKEMLPVGDRPAVQHVVEECLRAGAHRVVFVTGEREAQLRRHFGRNGDEAGDGLDVPPGMRKVVFEYVRQLAPLGSGDAVASARAAVGAEPFMLAFGDAVYRRLAEGQLLARLINVRAKAGADAAVGLERVEGAVISRYGVAAVDPQGAVFRITGFIEKPAPAEAPSPWVSAARYVLPAGFMDVLADQRPGLNGEVQLTDALHRWILDGATVVGVPLSDEDRRYDVGNFRGLLEASAAMLEDAQAPS